MKLFIANIALKMRKSFKLINIIRKIRYLLTGIAIMLIVSPVIFIFPLSAHAQEADSIIINKIDFDNYPRVEIYVNFKEGSELEYLDLSEDDFTVLENGEAVTNLSIKGMDEIPDPIGVVLVLDASGSMKGEPITDALGAASLFLNEMRSIDKVAVVSFADNVTVHSDFTTDRNQLRDSISGIEARGETALFDGIYEASELFRSAGDIKHKFLIVLSDGGDTASSHTVDEVIEKALQEKISIYSIALLTPEFNPAAIEDISESTGGEILSTVDSKELQELYKNISKKIIGQYRISYTSLWPAAEGIEISVNVKKLELSGSTAVNYENPYYSPSPRKLAIDPKNYFFITLFETPWAKPVLLAIIFIAVTLLIYLFILFIPVRRKTLKDKAKPYGFKTEGEVTGEEADEREEGRKGFIGWVIRVVSRIATTRGFIEFFDLKLDRAGMKIRASEFITLHISVVLIITLLVHYFSRNIILTILVMLIVVISPFLFLNIKTANRLKNFHAQLPDVLQLISGSLKAGYSFSQAMSMVVEESKPPISDEFRRTLNEIRMGISERKALENTAARIKSEYFDWAVMAINVQREVGGNLAELMETISNTIRERDRVMNRIKTLTSEGRLSAFILIALPFGVAMLMFFMNREYISLLYTTVPGLLMILVSGLLMIIGIIWIIKIIQIKY